MPKQSKGNLQLISIP